jgi:transposase
VNEQRQRFLEDYQLNYYSITELAERFGISRKTAYKWINRFEEDGQAGFHEQSRRPHSCAWQTESAIVEELVALRKAHTRPLPAKSCGIYDCSHLLPKHKQAAMRPLLAQRVM